MDVVTLGESMVTFLPSRPGRLADVPSFDRGIGGAESNVACGLAAAGHCAKWVSRVGADGFGRHLVERIAARGVDTSAVRIDPSRPTGIYFRTAGERALVADASSARGVGGASRAQGTEDLREPDAVDGAYGGAEEDSPAEVVYYRSGSAASAMSPANMPGEEIRSGRVLHLSGITAALSDDCLALLRDLTAPRPGRPLVSFDVNYRVDLWHDRTEAGGTLLDLARGSDLVFVGADEAEAAWGVTGGPAAIRATLPEPRVLVVKEGARGATVFERGGTGPAQGTGPDTVTYAPALHVDVVAHVGAGDAFAAGFLSATLRGLPVRDRIRHGHLMAAAALTVPGDLAAPATREHADRLVALDDGAWGTLRLGPGWTRANEEVRTP
ncbi:sugar kinase [Streptomyces yerevanensis]|uniref:sugar kinase n=1 Tax=Streptomyces yerevanensis TaxID=66378 RepID=UPI000A501497|nr:sugar kinase [Streptomyces yerevanensis]